MNNPAISVLQLGMLFITGTGLLNHVTIVPVLLNVSGKDAWLSVCLTVLVGAAWIPVVLHLTQAIRDRSFTEWISEKWKGWSWIVLLPLSLSLLSNGAITMKETTDWTNVNYLPSTPLFVVAFVLAFACTKTAKAGLKVIAITNGILLPFILLFGYFVAIGNFPHKEYKLLLPVMENGLVPVLKGMLYAGSGLSELFLVVLLRHRVFGRIKYGNLLLLLILMAGLTIGPLTGSVAEFGTPEAAKQRYPAYEQWRILQLGRFIEHLDFLSIYQWLSGAFVRISLSIWLIGECLSTWFKVNRNIVLYLAGAAMFAFSSIRFPDWMFYNWLTDYFLPANFFIFVGISLLVRFYTLLFCRHGGTQT